MKKQGKKRTASDRPSDEHFLRDPKTYAPRFQRLAQALAVATDTRKRPELSHEECEALLEFYVDSERRGENVRTVYPAVFKHLTTCERCRTSYDLLTGAQAQDASRDLAFSAEPRIEVPFLVQAAPDATWSKQIRSPIGGARLGFVFKINPSHLARVIAQPPQLAMRGQITTERSLLLLDSIALGSRNVQVSLWLHRSADSDYARLEISVVSSSPLPEPLNAILRWNDHRHAAPIEQGVGWIDQLSISDLENAPISIEFEAGQPGAPTGLA